MNSGACLMRGEGFDVYIQARIGCSYISDLPYYKRAVWFEMKRLPLADYPKQQLEDFSRYVFGVKYAILTEVMARLERT